MITITEMTSDLPEVRNGCVFSLDGEKSATALMPEERSLKKFLPISLKFRGNFGNHCRYT